MFYMGKNVRFLEVFFHVLARNFVADIPFCVVVTSICSLVYFPFFVFGEWMVKKSQLYLREGINTLRSLCSWVSSDSNFFGTDTLLFHYLFLNPKWSGSMKFLTESFIYLALNGTSSLEKNC